MGRGWKSKYKVFLSSFPPSPLFLPLLPSENTITYHQPHCPFLNKSQNGTPLKNPRHTQLLPFPAHHHRPNHPCLVHHNPPPTRPNRHPHRRNPRHRLQAPLLSQLLRWLQWSPHLRQRRLQPRRKQPSTLPSTPSTSAKRSSFRISLPPSSQKE